MFDKILVVCIGNICRSPTGEALLKKLLPSKEISSAGLSVEKSGLVGSPANELALKVAQNHSLDLTEHNARQLTSDVCQHVDLILVMEKKHLELLTQLVPEARGKSMLFSQWTGGADIADPHRKSEEFFELTFNTLSSAAQAWAKKLSC